MPVRNNAKGNPLMAYFIREPWKKRNYCPIGLLPSERGPQCKFESTLKFNTVLCEMCDEFMKVHGKKWRGTKFAKKSFECGTTSPTLTGHDPYKTTDMRFKKNKNWHHGLRPVYKEKLEKVIRYPNKSIALKAYWARVKSNEAPMKPMDPMPLI